jgi:hypothetical protein
MQRAAATKGDPSPAGVHFPCSPPCRGRERQQSAAPGDPLSDLEALLVVDAARHSVIGEASGGRPRACQSPTPRLANRPGADSAAGRRSRLPARARVFSHSNALTIPLSVGRISSCYRLRAGYAALLRLAGHDRTRRDRDRLGAGDATLCRRADRAPAPRRSLGAASAAPTGSPAAPRRSTRRRRA